MNIPEAGIVMIIEGIGILIIFNSKIKVMTRAKKTDKEIAFERGLGCFAKKARVTGINIVAV